MRRRRPGAPAGALLAAALLAACVGGGEIGVRTGAEARQRVVTLLPARLADRAGWAADIHAALLNLDLPATDSNICAVIAVIEQESSFSADPPVAGLGRIAREEISRRAERLGVPELAVDLALRVDSPDGRSWGERIAAVKTEGELNQVFEDLIGSLPLGQRLFSGWNPVRTAGAMQVSIAFAEQHARERRYPYPVAGTIRHEVFTRRGGVYFGTAHLLDYAAPYERPIYRFADFNAGRWASRNAAFQAAVGRLAGVRLALDGDLVRHDTKAVPGATEQALRSISAQLSMDPASIRVALEQGESAAFERSALYRRVFERADRAAGGALARAVLPQIELRGPKLSRTLSTEWFARRVADRHTRCLSRGAGDGA